MKRLLALSALVLCVSMPVRADEQSSVLKRGVSIGNHVRTLKEKASLVKGYRKEDPNAPHFTEVGTWKIGDGFLEIETSRGAGFVLDITYIVADEEEQQRKALKVKEIDLANGEMTIVVPGWPVVAPGAGSRSGKPWWQSSP